MKKNNIINLSFGENCFAERMLERHGEKSFATPYSWGRSNIEYVLHLERDQYKDFLNPEKMYYDNNAKLHLNAYNEIQNKYDPLCMNGFEFTHHDVLKNESYRETFNRRVQRLIELKNSKINIFYHHRFCAQTDRVKLLEHLFELKNIYIYKFNAVNVVMFTQVLVDQASERRVEHHHINGIDIFVFYTLNIWGGNNQDVFWGVCDDDLIGEMFSAVKGGLKKDFLSHLKFVLWYKLCKKKIDVF